MNSYCNFLKVAVQAVELARTVIVDQYYHGFKIEYKKDGSPVTSADVLAEQIIRSHILKHFPDHIFYGEEGGQSGRKAKYSWIVDPIDGTVNYIRKIGLFATEVALMEENEFVVGVSDAPIMNELITATKNNGAFCNGKQIHVSEINKFDDSYVNFGSLNGFFDNNKIESLHSLLKGKHGTRGIGGAYGYHLLAQGKIDIMVEARLKIWDIAAQAVIIQEAGGAISDMNGKPLTLKTDSCIASNRKLHTKALSFFK